MSTATAPAKPKKQKKIDPFTLRRFSVLEYHKMIHSGILGPNDRVELLEGWIVHKMSQNPRHRNTISRTVRRIDRVLPGNWTMSVAGPVTLSESEPEPDISLARGTEETFDGRHPNPSEIGVLMEVADTSLLSDRQYKGSLYAQERVLEFWLINVSKRTVEVYTKPFAGKYQKKTEYTEKEAVPLILDGVKVADLPVSELIAK